MATTNTTAVDNNNNKKKKKLAVRQQEATPLPHDGPLYHVLQNKLIEKQHENGELPVPSSSSSSNHAKDTTASSQQQPQDEDLDQKCVEILWLEARNACKSSGSLSGFHHPTTGGGDHPSVPSKNDHDHAMEREALLLLHKLRTAAQVQHQLSALQLFKTKLLQQRQRDQQHHRPDSEGLRHETDQSETNQEDNDDNLSCTHNKAESSVSSNLASESSSRLATASLYRILLEWSASVETPLPLRKSIHSLLDSLWKMTEDTRTVTLLPPSLLTASFIQVVESITNMDGAVPNVLVDKSDKTTPLSSSLRDTSSRESWQRPVHSLDILFALSQLHDASPAPNTDGNTTSLSTPNSLKQEFQLYQHFLPRVWPFLQWLTTTHLLPRLQRDRVARSAMEESQPTQETFDDDEVIFEQAIQTASLTKSLLELTKVVAESSDGTQRSVGILPLRACRTVLSQLTWSLLASPWTPTESLVVISMAHGQLLADNVVDKEEDTSKLPGDLNQSFEGETMFHWKTLIGRSATHNQTAESLADLPRAIWLQGLLAAAATDHDMFDNEDSAEAQCLAIDFLDELTELVSNAGDPDVRLAAIKGLRTLTNRCLSFRHVCVHNNKEQKPDGMEKGLAIIVDRLLECVLMAWENPPTRKLANAIPPLFEATLDLSFSLGREQQKGSTNSPVSPDLPQKTFVSQSLVERFLQQPPNRKGRYKALELLLPRVGAKRLLEAGKQYQAPPLGPVEGAHDVTNDSKNQLLDDLLMGIGEIGHNTGPIADLWAKLLHGLLVENEQGTDMDTSAMEGSLPVSWIHVWVPSLAQSLTHLKDSKRRKQIASFCLPRLSILVGGQNSAVVATVFTALIDYIQNRLEPTHAVLATTPSLEHETFRDRQLWTVCEVIRYAAAERLFPQGSTNKTRRYPSLDQVVATAIPIERLREALLHFSPLIRVVAFQAMTSIVSTYPDSHDGNVTVMHAIFTEMELWKESLPYAIKTDAKEYMSSLLYCLLIFMDRLCLEESLRKTPIDASQTQSIMLNFVVDFLLKEVFLRKGAYPGTVYVKETFSLALLECIVVFTCRELDIAWESKLLPKGGGIFHRKRNQREEMVLVAIRQALLDREIVASLQSLLQSSWDSTRSSAFKMLTNQILMGRTYGQQDRTLLFSNVQWGSSQYIENRAFYLVSSPRQREADTGARSLALLCLCKPSFSERIDYMNKLLTILDSRTKEMKIVLEKILAAEPNQSSGGQLPLAHGIIRTLQFVIMSPALRGRGEAIPSDVLHRLTTIMCSALQVSLSVVADVKDGEQLEGLESDGTDVGHHEVFSIKGKINPGAIGANGIFASVSRLDDGEYQRRLASQRIIMGSWLLMKESCAAAALSLTAKENVQDRVQINHVGVLLISTLTSLKHTGAAYAAHNSLQQIAQLCFQKKHLQNLSTAWVERLLAEITQTEKVRDSTLRRSTGYGLGFLSIMRADVLTRKPPRQLCRKLVYCILRLAMPSKESLDALTETIYGTSYEEHKSVFQFSVDATVDHIRPTKETDYSVRTRVHALNVLRMMALDAPLSQEVQPYLGEAIAVAILGYLDPDWGVRNSSSMVFAACLLRIVDADKNAVNSETKSSNAITIAELFRLYPRLPQFLVAVLGGSLNGKLQVEKDLPPILPILILLYRVQPSHCSDQDSVAHFNPFVGLVFKSLGHSNLAIRKAASRALGNMASSHKQSPSFVEELYARAFHGLKQRNNWNFCHGCLLTINELIQAHSVHTEDSCVEALFHMVQVRSIRKTPPLCQAEVLLALSNMPNKDENHKAKLAKVCFALLSSANPSRSLSVTDVGFAETSRVASSVATRVVVLKMQASIVKHCDLEENDMVTLSSLLKCKLFDARIASVKVLKKSIYGMIDQCLVSSEVNRETARRVLSKLHETIFSSLNTEIRCDEGAHPPTLRRLARCLLECMDGEQSLNSEVGLGSGLGDVGISLWHFDKRKTALEREQIVGENATQLLGIVAELLSWDCQTSQLQGLVELVKQISSPAVSWRLRHSAVVTVRRLLRNREVPEDTRVPVWSLCFSLLQDSDADVRYVASKTITDFRTSKIVTLVPEHHLVGLKGVSYDSFLCETQRFGFDTRHRSSMMYRELLESLRTGKSDDIPNVGTDRKIFEAEEPNSYLECLLYYQASLKMVLDLPQRNTDDTQNEVALECLSLCNEIAWTIANVAPEAAVEMTRSNSLFPGLHALLLGCSVIVYMGIGERTNVNVEALANLCHKDSHPFVRGASLVLTKAKKDDKSTYDGLLDQLFLLQRKEI